MKLAQINENIEPHFPPKSCSFQFGDCGIEMYRVVQKALASGFHDFIVVEGMVLIDGKILPHTWIEINGRIKDPTISMFGHGAEIEYSPEGEYREESSPEDFIGSFIDQYGDPT